MGMRQIAYTLDFQPYHQGLDTHKQIQSPIYAANE